MEVEARRWRILRALQFVPLALVAIYADVAWSITRRPPTSHADQTVMAIVLGAVSIAALAIGLPVVRVKLRARPRAAYLVSWLICVCVAIWGLIAVILTGTFALYLPFAGAALIGVAASTPPTTRPAPR